MESKMQLPKWCWSDSNECVVMVLTRGHFPDTVMVQLPSDQKIEVALTDLRINHGN